MLSKSLEAAVQNLRYLLNHGYPRDSAVNFVSNHYRLPLPERHLLARCVFSKQEATEHRQKSIGVSKVRGKQLGIDGYNVLITSESILMNKQVVRCDDGFVRDLRAIFGKYRPSRTTERTISEILKIVKTAKPREVVVLFDKQISKSGEVSGMVRRKMKELCLDGNAVATGGVDFMLRKFDVVATSDRAIIKRAKAVWDLPAELLKRKGARILNLFDIR